MRNDLLAPIRGTFTAISSCGRGGVVTLDQPLDGFKYAVVNPDTKGRIPFMNASKDGRLEHGVAVLIEEAERGSEAYRAISIKQMQ